MKKNIGIGSIVVVAVVLAILFCKSIKIVGAGQVATIYTPNGGIKDEVLTAGWHPFVNPMYKIKKFSIANEQIILSKDSRDGSKDDDSFKVATSDDASISISFQMSYRFIEKDVPETFRKFKGMSGEDIVNGRVKTVLKSKISEVTTNYSMMDIYSGNRAEINNKLTDYLNKQFTADYGIEVLDCTIIDVHPDDKLKEAIDKRVTALQEKQQAQAEQEKVKIEKETELLKAEADAKITVTNAEAQAKANQLINNSISENLIKMKEAEARLKHGWVTVNGASTVVTDNK